MKKILSLLISALMVFSSLTPALLYAEETVVPVVENIVAPVAPVQEVVPTVTAPVVENVLPVVETPEITPVVSVPVTEAPPAPISAPISVAVENPVPVSIPVTVTDPVPTPVTIPVVVPEITAPVAPVPVVTTVETTPIPATESIPVSQTVIDTNNVETDILDEETGVEESVDEEVDMEDIDLGDDAAELDALKDFTAIVRQSKDYTCGPASLATLLTQLGTDTSEQTIIENIASSDINETQGTTLLALKSVSVVLGNNTYLKKWNANTVLEYIQRTEDPVLIHDEKKDVGGHFSVIKSYDAEKGIVELSDTEAGNIKYSVEDFEHIYTGHVLIISSDGEDVLLSDPTTDINDIEAATIWGKYVPVVMYAQKNGYTTAVNNFRNCTNRALSFKTVVERNYERQICYNTLASTLGSTMNIATELGFIVSYNASYLIDPLKEHLNGEFGLNAMLTILNQKLNANKALLTKNQTAYNTKANTYNTLVEGNPGLKTKVGAYNKALTDKTLFTNSISGKNTTITTLNKEINNKVFIQNNVTFSLGVVGNQVVAQQSNYNRISQSLASTISSLDGQIKNAQKSLDNANGSYKYWNDKYTSLMSNYNSYVSAYNNAISNRDYFYNLYYYGKKGKTTSNWNNYQGWITKANTANTNKTKSYNDAQKALGDRNYWSGQVTSYANQVNSLTAKKNTEQAKVDKASAELSRLQTLKAFGDKEMQRKKGLVTTLGQEVSALGTQLTKANKDIADLPAVINLLRAQLQKTYASLAYELTVLRSELTILQSEIDRQVQEVANEEKFEKNADNNAQVKATYEARTFAEGAINKVNIGLATVCGASSLASLSVVAAPVSGPVAGVSCSLSFVLGTPVAAIQAIKGSTLLTNQELSTFDQVLNGTVAAVPLAAYGAKVLLTATKTTQGGQAIVLVSDGTQAGEQSLVAARQALTNTLTATIRTRVSSLFSGIKSVDDIASIANANKLGVSRGNTSVIIGVSENADDIVKTLVGKGWKVDPGVTQVTRLTAPDGLTAINVRTVSSSAQDFLDQGYSVQRTIDLMKKVANEMKQFGEVKFVLTK